MKMKQIMSILIASRQRKPIVVLKRGHRVLTGKMISDGPVEEVYVETLAGTNTVGAWWMTYGFTVSVGSYPA